MAEGGLGLDEPAESAKSLDVNNAKKVEQSESEAYHVIRDNFQLLRRKYDALAKAHNQLLWEPAVLEAAGIGHLIPRVDTSLFESARKVSEIELLKVIGRGAFSSVFLGQWPSKEKCAVKRIHKAAAKSILDLTTIATEHEALMTLSRGPSVLGLHCSFATATHIYFVLEFFGEQLYKYMQSHQHGLPALFGYAVIHGVSNGLAFMHDLSFAHRDIKPENVLIHVTGHRFADVVVKLCDLGLCARLEPLGNSYDDGKTTQKLITSDPLSPLEIARSVAPQNKASPENMLSEKPAVSPVDVEYKPLFNCCGSMGFFAPDMLDSKGYSGAAVDVWSLGCLGLEVVSGDTFFEAFWFNEYTTYFKTEGRAATYKTFREWMHMPVADLATFVQRCVDAHHQASQKDASVLGHAHDNGQASKTVKSSSLDEGKDFLKFYTDTQAKDKHQGPEREHHDLEGTESTPKSRVRIQLTAKQEQRLYENWRILSMVAKCLRLEPRMRPQAFEIRDMLAAFQNCDPAAMQSAVAELKPEFRPDAFSGSAEVNAPKAHSKAGEKDKAGVFDQLKSRLCRITPTLPGTPAASPKHGNVNSEVGVINKASPQSSLFGKHYKSSRVAPDQGSSPSTRKSVELTDASAEEESSTSDLLSERSSRSSVSKTDQADTVARALNDFSPSRQRGKVLVVDDSSLALHWICKAIESKYNCEVHTASSAMEALSHTEHNDYDAVLTDMIMPHMDGFQLVSALRAREAKKRERDPDGNHKRLFICALTQLAEAFDVQDNADVDVVSKKPFGKALDLDFLSDYLERRDASS